jgi:hypothetical protein
MGKNRDGPEKNLNDPGYVQEEESIYQKKNEEERKKIPVEYLSYVQRRHSVQVIKTLIILIILIAILGFGPGTNGQEYCPECGRLRSRNTLAWGHWGFHGLTPVDTEWTAWFMAQNPEPHIHHWVPFGPRELALFALLKVPLRYGHAWEIPDNLVTRMNELKPFFRPGKIMDIPRALSAVNNAEEWRSIIVPLTLGTPQEAFDWWDRNSRTLEWWAAQPRGFPLPEDFMTASQAYIDEKTPKTSDTISF